MLATSCPFVKDAARGHARRPHKERPTDYGCEVSADAAPSTAPRRGEGRQALLAAIVRLVAREGLDGLTFRAVASEAGVTHGLASYHFRSRDAMVAEALAWETERSIRLSELEPSTGRIEDLASELPSLIARDPDGAAFQFAMALEARNRPELRNQVRLLYDHYVAVVGRSLTRGGIEADETLARVVFAAIDGLVLQQLIYGDEEMARAALERLRDLLTQVQDHVVASPDRPPEDPSTRRSGHD
jgi:AcrR family transcriptional regulator